MLIYVIIAVVILLIIAFIICLVGEKRSQIELFKIHAINAKKALDDNAYLYAPVYIGKLNQIHKCSIYKVNKSDIEYVWKFRPYLFSTKKLYVVIGVDKNRRMIKVEYSL